MIPVDPLWEQRLSEDPALIRRAWNRLTNDECEAVLTHLRRMRDDGDWSVAQQQRAACALQALAEQAS
jgi:hypothetical protein